MTLKNILTVFFTLAVVFASSAQGTFNTKNKKAIKHHKEAQKQFESKNNTDALKFNLKSLKADPEFIEALVLNAYIHITDNHKLKAISSFEKAVKLNPHFFPGNLLHLGELYFRTQQYQKSFDILAVYVKQYKPKAKTKQKALFFLASSQFALKALKNPVPFTPENLGPNVNSKLKDYNPVMDVAQTKITFTRTTPNNSPAGAREDIFTSLKQNDTWTLARSEAPPLNSELREGAPSLTSDGNTMLLTICETFGNYGQGRNGLGSCDLFVSTLSNGKWINPRNLGKTINSKYFDSQSSISSNGSEIYFCSSRPGGFGKTDLYVCEVKSGKLTTPKNLGFDINTNGSEQGVFIHPDNSTLYFTSDGHPGMGRSDIFMSKRKTDGTWGKPVNLGYPINTFEDEWGLTIDATGTFAYFASDREGGFGEMDIYKFPLPEALKPTPVTYLKGFVFDMDSKIPVPASIELIDLATKKTVFQSFADRGNGEFFVCLPSGKDYALNVSQDGYLFHSENFTMTEGTKLEPYKKDIGLEPIKVGVPVVLNNIFFDTDKSDLKPKSETELEILYTFLSQNPMLKIEISGHTDNRGGKDHNVLLSINRSKSVYDYLMNKGITADRLSFKGYGDEKPRDSNDTVTGRANNRRTEFMVVK
ncbi:MAG: outer membrane protein OmpA-like peptidoglycan-associated protein [Glaciecola sp.]|jgi:outer membrane protein OmpA-like peptidoglycan-associated protein